MNILIIDNINVHGLRGVGSFMRHPIRHGAKKGSLKGKLERLLMGHSAAGSSKTGGGYG